MFNSFSEILLFFLAQRQNMFLLKNKYKKHLYPLKLSVPPNNTARYTDVPSFFQGFMGFTTIKNYCNRKNRPTDFHQHDANRIETSMSRLQVQSNDSSRD